MSAARKHAVPVEPWNDAGDADHAFPSDWRAQCDLAEAHAIEDEPAWAHESKRERACFWLWLDVFAIVPCAKVRAIVGRR